MRTTAVFHNIRIAECPSHFVALNQYAPNSPALDDYRQLAKELIAQEETVRKRRKKSFEEELHGMTG